MSEFCKEFFEHAVCFGIALLFCKRLEAFEVQRAKGQGPLVLERALDLFLNLVLKGGVFAKLRGVERVEQPLFLHEFWECSLLDDRLVVEDKDAFNVLDRGKPVGNDEHGLVFPDLLNCLLDALLAHRVKGSGWLIEDDHSRVFEEDTDTCFGFWVENGVKLMEIMLGRQVRFAGRLAESSGNSSIELYAHGPQLKQLKEVDIEEAKVVEQYGTAVTALLTQTATVEEVAKEPKRAKAYSLTVYVPAGQGEKAAKSQKIVFRTPEQQLKAYKLTVKK